MAARGVASRGTPGPSTEVQSRTFEERLLPFGEEDAGGERVWRAGRSLIVGGHTFVVQAECRRRGPDEPDIGGKRSGGRCSGEYFHGVMWRWASMMGRFGGRD